jgi:hypothetical protein
VQYFFPVEIEVRTAPADVDPREIASLALSELAEGLAAAPDGHGGG